MNYLRAFLLQLRSGDWLSRRHIRRCTVALLAFELAGFLFLVAGTHGLILHLDKPTSTDFVSFYAAGRLADDGTPQLAYDRAAHYAAEQRATEPGIDYVHFFYPPVFLMLCAAVAWLPYGAAFAALVVLTFIPYFFVIRRVMPERGWDAMLPLLAFPSVLWTFGFGQNAFLTAALFGAATLLVDRRPAVAGLLFGALCYKPHFGLLVPIALAAAGNWRAFAAAALSAGGLMLLSLGLFGTATWHAYLAAAAGSPAAYQTGTVDHAAFVNPYGAVLVLGGSLRAAYAAQAATMLAAAALVCWTWRQKLSLPVRSATLAAATLAAIPVVLIYDLVLATIAAGWLLRAGREDGLPAWGKTLLAVLFVLPMMARSSAQSWHVPLGPLAVLGLLGLAAAAARREFVNSRPAGAATPSPAFAGPG